MGTEMKWGIAGAGRSIKEFIETCQSVPNKHKCVAIAAREGRNVKSFAKENSIPKFYQSFEELARDKDVEVVYIGETNPQHFPICKMMLENRKHVLCEKPLAIRPDEIKQLITLAKSNKVFLLERLAARFFPAYKKLKELLNLNIIGDVIYCNVTLGFSLQDVSKSSLKELYGGAITELGGYALQLVQLVFKQALPVQIVGQGNLNFGGVDQTTNALLLYPDGKSAVISCSICFQLQNDAVVIGTRGMIRIPSFWSPTVLILPTENVEFETPGNVIDESMVRGKLGMYYSIEEVHSCIKNGLVESTQLRLTDSLTICDIINKIRDDIGVTF